MHSDARKIENNTLLTADLCIIGGGAAGISIALQFISTSYKVLLLESGGFEYDVETQLLQKGSNVGLKYFPLESCRLRFFGGTTAHWAGYCAPLDEIDFKERDWVPDSGWPISKADVDPYYARAQPICDLGPFNYDVAFWETQKNQSARLPFDKNKVRTKIWQKSSPTRFGTKYRKEIIDAVNVHLYTFANVTNIELSKIGSHVTGLEVKTMAGKQHRVEARNYILACGGIENSRLLLNSNLVMKNGLGNQNGLVGKYFMEHPHVDSADLILSGKHEMNLYYQRIPSIKPFGMLSLSEQYQRKHRLLNYSSQLDFNPRELEHEPVLDPLPENTKEVLDWWKKVEKSSQEEHIGDNHRDVRNYVFSTRIEQAPNANSRIELTSTKDALGLNQAKLNWQLTDLDKKTIKEAAILIGKEVGRLGIGRLRLREWLSEEPLDWPDYLSGGCHHMGGTRMNKDPKRGVVNENCKVHGLPNLYVAGSSVFPTGGTSNPTLTIVALSLRLADHIKTLFERDGSIVKQFSHLNMRKI